MDRNRNEHLEWCKARALGYVDINNLENAWVSMKLDLDKHEETKDHSDISLGDKMLISGHLSSINEMRKFINGFN